MMTTTRTLALNAPFLAAVAAVYLTGPVRNIAAFEAAAIALRSLGLTVLSPIENAAEGLREALAEDVESVLEADAVVVLDGWEASPSSVVEVTLAEALAKPVATLDEVLATRGPANPGYLLALTVA